MDSAELKNNIVGGTFWKLGERICAQGISFLISIILARLLSPEDYGIVAIVMVFISLADVFVISGFNAALIQKKDADNTDFSTIFFCSLAVSMIIYIVLYITAPYIALFYRNDMIVSVVRIFSLRIPLGVYNSIQHAYVSRNMLFKRFFYSTLIGTIFSGIVGIVLAYMGFGVWALIGQYFTNTIVDTIVLRITISWHLEFRFSLSSAKKLMNYGWKILLSELSGTFFDKLRELIIGRFYTASDLAYYNKGKSFPDTLNGSISASIMTVLFPAFANLGDDLIEIKKMTRRAVKVMSYILFPLLGGLAAISDTLILLLLTDKWEMSIPYMRVFCISTVIGIIGGVALQSIKAIGRSDVILILEFKKKPVYLVLLIIGVQINVFAVAITMLIYTVYATFVNAIQLKKYIRYDIFEQLKDMSSGILPVTFMVLLVVLVGRLHLHNAILLLIQISVGAIFYIGLSEMLHIESYMYIKDILISICTQMKRK